jgi:hypothetical protein
MTSSGGGTESSDLDAVTSSIGVALPLAALVALDLVVIVGNSLVVTAVFTHAKLRRSKTNMFVVSLAVADLMVGIAVLPFSSANEVRPEAILFYVGGRHKVGRVHVPSVDGRPAGCTLSH